MTPPRVGCFWICRLRPSWRLLDRAARRAGIEQGLAVFREAQSGRLRLLGAYSLNGLQGDADLMLWWLASEADDIQELAGRLRRSQFGDHLEVSEAFLGEASGEPAGGRDYVALCPVQKSAEWYLLPRPTRLHLIEQHGEAASKSGAAGSTLVSSGVGAADFLVALEADSLGQVVESLEALHQVEARSYGAPRTPAWIGRLRPLEVALADFS